MPDDEHRVRVALELNALHSTGALGDLLEGATIGAGTPIYDLNDELLYARHPLTGVGGKGYADVAVHQAIGGVLMAISHGLEWKDEDVLNDASQAVKKYLGADAARAPFTTRFVAYSYPKLAVQFLSAEGKELALLELWSWRPVPPLRERAPGELPTFNERSSFLDSQADEAKAHQQKRFKRRVRELMSIPNRQEISRDGIAGRPFADQMGAKPPHKAPHRRELRFSRRSIDHHTCYEVQGQRNSLWCVAASVQMLLDFYRYEYTQDRLAAKLGLGTNRKPRELADFHAAKIVPIVESLSGNALEVTMKRSPTWTDFRREIGANRPVLSFVPGHARTIAGYMENRPLPHHLSTFRGLLVYDPWPPNEGVVTRWENIDVQTYTVAFMARLRHA